MAVKIRLRRALAVMAAAVLLVAAAPTALADSEFVNNDRVYAAEEGRTVYISADNYLYHFLGDVPGVTVCGYAGRMKDIVIPEEINGRSVSAIDRDAFANNEKITSVKIPVSVLSIGEGSFNGCTALEQVTLSGGAGVLQNVFCDCPQLKSMTFPYGVSEINGSFRNCAALSEVTFSRSVTKLGDGSFNGCSSIASIQWSTGLSYLGDVFDGNQMLSTIHIPQGITVINGAFDNCLYAEVLELPDSLVYINSGFNDCPALRRVEFPKGLLFIGGAFKNCANLSDVHLPSSTNVDKSAFVNCPHVKLQKGGVFQTVAILAVLLVLAGGVVYLVRYGMRYFPLSGDSDEEAADAAEEE